ncbi:zinc finger MYM-type protein 1 [Trichonephila clavipes]|nr:zinc finger MYM-type protein 1 [Trichonephila clavipes]
MQVLLMHYGCWQFIIQTKPEQPDEEATYKEKLDLQLRIQSTVQQIYRWKEEDFRVVKIEAELILEANRLQLMKQDLEKAENAYLSSFTLKKSKTLPGATAAAHGDPNDNNDYQKKSGKTKVNSNLGYNLNLPDYYDDEDDSDRAKDSLTSRLVSKTSTETPSTSEKPDVSSDNNSLIPCTEVKWIRNIVTETTGEYLTNAILGEQEKNGLDIENCRGQGYDNGANMVGINSGVKTRILNRNPKALFTPCGCHSLNLSFVEAANS